jgi:hypothetical protein
MWTREHPDNPSSVWRGLPNDLTDAQCVNRHGSVTPPMPRRSMPYRAARHRDPAPNNSLELPYSRTVAIHECSTHDWGHTMLNPWLTLSFQAVRFGWETQSIEHEMGSWGAPTCCGDCFIRLLHVAP